MLWLIGVLAVLGAILGGYTGEGAPLRALWQPFEFLIIVGTALGAMLTSATFSVLKKVPHALYTLIRGPKYRDFAFTELLTLLYTIFKTIRIQGILELEKHLENPQESFLFKAAPSVLGDRAALTFLCDYLRTLTMGADDPIELEFLMDEELRTFNEEGLQVPLLFQQIADGLPAIGIIAAVLGVIHTMQSIAQPPEILGSMIGAALVGTFLGVLLSYGFVGPMANGLRAILAEEIKFFEVMKAGVMAHIRGQPPAIAVEFARKSIFANNRPSFEDVEAAVQKLRS
jgi:chemotaxis protein MotA